MMRSFLMIAIVMYSAIVSAQGLLNSRARQSDSSVPPLVELMPFTNAVIATKAGEGAGIYAVAIHYALGKEIERDNEKAAKYLAKAVEKKYPVAIFVSAMVLENRLSTHVDALNGRSGRLRRSSSMEDKLYQYTGGAHAWQFNDGNQKTTSFTNVADVAKVKALYETAIKLGVNAATNELARFEKRVLMVQTDMKKKIEENNAHRAMLARNAQFAKDILGEDSKTDQRKQEVVLREAEREEQRRQLKAIQDELRKAREARRCEVEQMPARHSIDANADAVNFGVKKEDEPSR